MLGLDLVSIQNRNLTLNNLDVPNGDPLFQNGELKFAGSSSLSKSSFLTLLCDLEQPLSVFPSNMFRSILVSIPC